MQYQLEQMDVSWLPAGRKTASQVVEMEEILVE